MYILNFPFATLSLQLDSYFLLPFQKLSSFLGSRKLWTVFSNPWKVYFLYCRDWSVSCFLLSVVSFLGLFVGTYFFAKLLLLFLWHLWNFLFLIGNSADKISGDTQNRLSSESELSKFCKKHPLRIELRSFLPGDSFFGSLPWLQ